MCIHRECVGVCVCVCVGCYLVGGELGEEIGVVGECFDFETGSVDIDPEQLSSIGAKGNLFDLVAIDQL